MVINKREQALNLYMQGRFSVGQASKFAGIYISEFYDCPAERGVESNLTLDDFRQSLKNLK